MTLKLNIFNYTPLLYAIEFNSIEIVKILVSNPEIDINLITISNNINFKYNSNIKIFMIF